MLAIKKLSGKIKGELKDAEEYARCALETKEEDRELADLYYRLSSEELGHMEKLHEQVVRLINKYRAEVGEPPADMKAVYDYLHMENIEEARSIRVMLSMYKG